MSLDVGPGVLGALGSGDSLVGGGGGGGGVLAPLEAGGGGGVSDVVDVVSLGGVVELGPGALLSGMGLGKVVSLDGPGVLGVLVGESLVSGGGVLEPLGNGGGVGETSDCVSLGGTNDPPSLLPGMKEPGDVPGLAGAPLDGSVALPCDIGDGTCEGPGLVGDGESADTSECVEPTDPGEKLGGGGGEPLCGGVVTELSVVLAPLGASDVVDDGNCDAVGLVEAADGTETGETEGITTLDGPSMDDGNAIEPELGWPDGGAVGLLPGVDVGDVLGADGAPLLGNAEGCELAMGLVESPGLPDFGDPDVGEPDAAEPDVGLVLDSGSTLPDGGDARLLPGIDVGEMLGADGTSLLGGAEG